MRLKIISALSVFFLLSSCEYEVSDDQYIEKEKPIPNKQIEINLTGVQPNDTIYIYKKTSLFYSINSRDEDILSKAITLDGKSIENSQWGGLLIDPKAFDNSIHKLHLSVSVKTNTGSLAEKLGFEKYEGEYEYTLKYVHVDYGLKITDDITKDDYLKIVWEKPQIEKLEVEKYEVTFDKDWSSNSRTTITITDPNQTYVIDKNYVWGYKDYEITTYFKGNKIDPWQDRYTMSYDLPINNNISIEEVGIEDALVSWKKNKYRCSYILKTLNDGTIDQEIRLDYSKTSRTIPFASFPNPTIGYLHVLPENYDEAYSNWGSVFFSKSYSSMDKDWYFSQFAYNTENKSLYGLGQYKLIQFDAINQEQVKVTWIDYLNYFFTDKLSCSPRTRKIAVMHVMSNKVYILDDKVNILNEFNLPSFDILHDSQDDTFCITDDDRLIISGSGHSRKAYICDLNGNTIYQISLPPTPYKTKINTSTDGQYLCYYSGQNIKIYKLGDTHETLIYDQNMKNIEQCNFHPVDKDKIIIQQAGTFYIYNIITQDKSNSIKGTYLSTDPFTGNILYYAPDYSSSLLVNIIKPDLSSNLNKIHIRENYNVELFNNVLIGSNNDHMTYNYYKNLSKYLK